MSSPDYKEFHHEDYKDLRKSLIRRDEKRPDRQRDFLERVRHTQDFLELVEEKVRIVGDDDLDSLAGMMSEAEFKDPPPDTEKRLFEAWGSLTPRIACRTPFWGYVTWRHIKAGHIESHYLAASRGSLPGGVERIDKAVEASGDEAAKLLDRCVRDVLRRLGGLPEVRGNRTIYVNCPLSRSWWRERFVREASSEDPETARRVGQVVRVSQEYWERLVLFVVSRNSVFGSPKIRNAFVRHIGEHMAGDPQSPLRNADDFLTPACRTLSTVQASRELSVVPSDDAEAVVRDVVEMHLEALHYRSAENGATN